MGLREENLSDHFAYKAEQLLEIYQSLKANMTLIIFLLYNYFIQQLCICPLLALLSFLKLIFIIFARFHLANRTSINRWRIHSYTRFRHSNLRAISAKFLLMNYNYPYNSPKASILTIDAFLSPNPTNNLLCSMPSWMHCLIRIAPATRSFISFLISDKSALVSVLLPIL